MSDYKPTEHDGLRKDGQPDKRVGTGVFAQGQLDPSEEGAKGGKTGGKTSGTTGDSDTNGSESAGGSDYKPTEHDGLRKDGQPDGRVKGN